MWMMKWILLDCFDLWKRHVVGPKSARRGELVHGVWAVDKTLWSPESA